MVATRDAFSEEERAAMRARATETRTTKGAGAAARAAAEFDAAIAALPDDEARIASRLAALAAEHAPQLATRTWYGMPAWTLGGAVLCYFKPASKYRQRYSTLGFEGAARLDDGTMWPTSWALTDLTEADEAAVVALISRAVATTR